ncbi:hypothetical protein [Microbacterium resistens]|uniref:hypothetical protein n=1 Tax=Microbacterium resistens TaxID=156977 RepID=UPI0036731E3F
MPGDGVRVLLAQGLELVARRRVQILRGDLVGKLRVPRAIGSAQVPPRPLGTIRRAVTVPARVPAVATREAAVSAVALMTRRTIPTLISAFTTITLTTRRTVPTLVPAFTTITLTTRRIRPGGGFGARTAFVPRRARSLGRSVTVIPRSAEPASGLTVDEAAVGPLRCVSGRRTAVFFFRHGAILSRWSC